MTNPAITTYQQEFQKAIEHLKQEFSRLQTGRANASLVEHIMVEAYGQMMEMKAVASISIQDARSMVIQPWDKSVLSAIEKAVQQADIGSNPVNDGVVIRLNFPPMTEERRLHLKKVVSQLAEQTKIKIRQLRQEANTALSEEDAEDEKARAEKDLQKHVDDANVLVEELAKKKEAEVMTV